ncbi:MAG TPA: LON peptidase substrate-binding domain-containing protein [Gammaproteobacteria bacterium]|nr:LON peptidase substrate-binding domain-containing protein [Gammaproteobacteria bacterium]
MAEPAAELALFPLNTVLFPDGPLPLRIFEPRYLDMVSRCLKQDQGFGVCLIEQSKETGRAHTHDVGTLARIADWSGGEDGMLHILAHGRQRFRVHELRTQQDGLNLAEVELLDAEPTTFLPETAYPLAELLRQIMTQVPEYYRGIEPRYDDASWVSYRLAELLPLPLAQRQYFLELSNPVQRLEILQTLVESLAEQ